MYGDNSCIWELLGGIGFYKQVQGAESITLVSLAFGVCCRSGSAFWIVINGIKANLVSHIVLRKIWVLGCTDYGRFHIGA